jgi:transposase InsO family protein
MASNYVVGPATAVLQSYKDANQRYSDQWLMRHGTYQIPRFVAISASHSSKMSYKKEAPNITTA